MTDVMRTRYIIKGFGEALPDGVIVKTTKNGEDFDLKVPMEVTVGARIGDFIIDEPFELVYKPA